MLPRILIVDDESSICISLSLALEPEYEVIWETDPIRALERLQTEPIDLVLLDMVIGPYDGLDILMKIKKLAPLAAVIMMTGMSSIQWFLFMIARTSNPSISGITISNKTSEISSPYFCREDTACNPFSASIISNSSSSISDKIERLISESSVISIFFLEFFIFCAPTYCKFSSFATISEYALEKLSNVPFRSLSRSGV